MINRYDNNNRSGSLQLQLEFDSTLIRKLLSTVLIQLHLNIILLSLLILCQIKTISTQKLILIFFQLIIHFYLEGELFFAFHFEFFQELHFQLWLGFQGEGVGGVGGVGQTEDAEQVQVFFGDCFQVLDIHFYTFYFQYSCHSFLHYNCFIIFIYLRSFAMILEL